MSYKLFLDDERLPYQVKWVEMPLGPWVTVRSHDDFVKHIMQHGLPSFVSFDHDLAAVHYVQGMLGKPPTYSEYKEKTGYESAKWLVEYCMEYQLGFPDYQVHSMNPVGAENIRGYIENFKAHHLKYFHEEN